MARGSLWATPQADEDIRSQNPEAHVTTYVNRLKAGSQDDNGAIQRLGFPLVLLEGSLVIASFGLLRLAKNWM